MEEAPRGTFQDELEWCIQQLETGLLQQTPTPPQGDTQRILKVLRSREAPFVKKRQVMSQVFGDYRQRMAEERRRVEAVASQPSSMQVHEGDVKKSGSIVYRKCSSEASDKGGKWFAPSDNSFRFSFSPCEEDQEPLPTDSGKTQPEGNVEGKRVPWAGSSSAKRDQDTPALNWTADGNSGSEFTFNFIVPEEAQGQDVESPAQELRSSGQPSVEQERTDAEDGACNAQSPNEGETECPMPETRIAPLQSDEQPCQAKEETPKKKKKKLLQGKKEAERATVGKPGKVPASEGLGKSAVPSAEASQPVEEQLRREVDWCVEQLELGIKRQKSTPKQVDEALRAVKILRSEKAALVKKRQIMRAMLGDYRKKMEEERGKQLRLLQAATKSARVAAVREEARRSSSHVYRMCTERAQKDRAPARSQELTASPGCSAESTSPQSQPRATGTSGSNPFMFKSSKDEFCFNFF